MMCSEVISTKGEKQGKRSEVWGLLCEMEGSRKDSPGVLLSTHALDRGTATTGPGDGEPLEICAPN